MLKFLLVICALYFSTVYASQSSSATSGVASEIRFNNFDKSIRLRWDGTYYLTDEGLSVQLNDQLLVKTNKRLLLNDLISAHDDIVEGKEVFVAHNFNYYLVKFAKHSNMGAAINTLTQASDVLLVQPDILQMGYPQASVGALGLQQSLFDSRMSNTPGRAVFAHDSHTHLTTREQKEVRAKRQARIYRNYLTKVGVPKLWDTNVGEGIRIAIIDDGIELRHPALVHVNKTLIYDVDSHVTTLDAMATGADHGTQIAGVIFSAHDSGVSNNIRGLAPGASLIALRNPSTRTSKTLLAFQLAMLANADIINCSWNTHRLLQPIADAVNELAKHGREGKGTAIIFAAGNDGMEIENQRVEASLDAALVVAASNPRGKRLLSSNYGESVDLLVYGRGVHSTAGKEEYKVFAGTSLAAAITTGLAAITLATNHDLTLKQLQAQLVSITSH